MSSQPPDLSLTDDGANVEWRLADFTDAVASEVDRAQDTLALKSHTRGFSVSLKGLSLELSVHVRVDELGQIFYRTATPGETGASLLKLELEEVSREQIEEVRMPVDDTSLGVPLSSLPQITEAEIRALQAYSLFTVDDLRRYARTPALLTELSRRTGIAETRLRLWLDLPYVTRVVPPAGRPGQRVVLEGANFGSLDAGDQIFFFPERRATIASWSPSAIAVWVPDGTRAGPVYGLLDGARTNAVAFAEERLDLRIVALERTPLVPMAGEPVLFRAVVENWGPGPTGPFTVAWRVDADTVQVQEVDLAASSSRTLELRQSLTAGAHTVRVTIDPDAKLPLVNRAAAESGQTFTVASEPEPIRLTGLLPASGAAGGTLDIILLGSGFRDGISASFGTGITVESVRVEGPTRLAAHIVIAATAAAGARDVTVAAPDGSTSTLRSGFEVIVTGPVRINSVFPAGAIAGSSLELTIRGAGFQPGATVSFDLGIVARQTRVVSGSELRTDVTLPTDRQGTATVTVVNPDGSRGEQPKAFHIFPPPVAEGAASAAVASKTSKAATRTAKATRPRGKKVSG